MVLNALGLTGRALYLMPEYMKNKPIDILIREGLVAEDFNDDSLGRALDELHQMGITELFAVIASQAVEVFEIETDYAHLDTSSFSVTGHYDSDYAQDMAQRYETVKITHGYSKEQRPDLKQVVLSLLTSQASSIPLWLEVLDGNSSDKTSFRETVTAYYKQFAEGEVLPCIVMDSAGYSCKNIQSWQGIPWLTRVPESIGEVKDLKQRVDLAQMTEVAGGTYRIYPTTSHYGDIEQRWLLVYSEQGYKREYKQLVKRIQKEEKKALKALKKLQRRHFNCQADARVAAETLAQTYKWHNLHIELIPLKKYQHAGRPPKDAMPTQINWQVSATVSQDADRIAQASLSLGRFVLASNELDKATLSDEQILSRYKEQSSAVERSFRFLRDPMFFADKRFVKSPVRIMAMTMIMGLALLVYSLAERELRRQLAQQDETLPSQTGQPTQAITLRRVAQIFEGVDVLIIRTKTKILSRQILNLSPLRCKILSFFSPHVQNSYFLII